MKSLSKITTILLFIVASTNMIFAQTTVNGDAIIGTFTNSDGNRKVEIYKKQNQYFGKLVSPSSAGAKSGMIILKNMIYADGKWTGKIFAPEKNTDFDASLELSDHNNLKIIVNAGAGSLIKVWKRVQ